MAWLTALRALKTIVPVGLTIGTLLGSTTAVASSPRAIPIHEFELDNGLEVILSEDRSVPLVAVNIWYHVGSKDEREGLSGFAHLFEHLMFQGAKAHDGEYFEPLREVGASINGSTNTDRTNYYETLPSQHLPLALWMEADRMGGLLDSLSQEKLDNQREVVRNERRQRYEVPPFGFTWKLLAEGFYPPGHPYRHLTIGTHEDLANADLEAVKAFFQRYYAPNNATLVIVGDFDRRTVKKLVQEYFGPIPQGVTIRAPKVEPARFAEPVVLRHYADVPESRVWVGWHSPPLFAPGDAELDLIAGTLAGAPDTRLEQRLVRETQVAKSVEAYQGSRQLGSTFLINATVAKGHTSDDVVREIRSVIQELLADRPMTQAEIDAARADLERRSFQSLATIKSRADRLNTYNHMTGDPRYLETDLARYANTTPRAVADFASEILGKPSLELHILPDTARPEEPEAQSPQRTGTSAMMLVAIAAPLLLLLALALGRREKEGRR